MEKQTNLFQTDALTIADKEYLRLRKQHLNQKLHIYSSNQAKSIILFYITNGMITGEMKQKLISLYKNIKPYRYYHFADFMHLYCYNGWIIKMILSDNKKN